MVKPLLKHYTRLRGNPVRAFQGICQGTVRCVSKATIRSVMCSKMRAFMGLSFDAVQPAEAGFASV
jgi:hypothetical protein